MFCRYGAVVIYRVSHSYELDRLWRTKSSSFSKHVKPYRAKVTQSNINCNLRPYIERVLIKDALQLAPRLVRRGTDYNRTT